MPAESRLAGPSCRTALPDRVVSAQVTSHQANSNSYLPLDSLVSLTDTHSTFRALAASPPLTPFAAPILAALLKGPAYPQSLRTLAWTHPYLPPALFLHILVRAPPRFILDELELPRLSSGYWQEAFRRRFLPSWIRYRDENTAAKDKPSWRATFLRCVSAMC